MRLKAIIFLVLGAFPLILFPFVLLANVMSLAGTPTGNETLIDWLISRTFLVGSTLYPFFYLVFAILSLIQMVRRNEHSALRWSRFPIFYLIGLVVVFGIWGLLGKLASLRSQGGIFSNNSSPVSECTPPVFDGGDQYETTGCGVVEYGPNAGRIGKITEANNWQFTAQNSYMTTISVKNDGKSCPMVIVLDSKGQVVEDFKEDNEMRTCLEGMINTYNYFLMEPEAGEVYYARVYAPDTPGNYWIEVK